jgi:hypothetical protein
MRKNAEKVKLGKVTLENQETKICIIAKEKKGSLVKWR